MRTQAGVRAREQNKLITIEEEQVVILQFTVSGGNSQSSFATIHCEESTQMRAAAKTRIVLVIPQFIFFVTGDLAFMQIHWVMTVPEVFNVFTAL
jgi:hypothetical protein